MEKNKVIIFVLVILLLTIFATIFRFSNQNGDKSLGLSKAITEKIVVIMDKAHHIEDMEKLKNAINKIIRKIAHFSLYTLVGIVSMSLMNIALKSSIKIKAIISLIIGAVYAITDEIHQIFVVGRTASITDVLIDTSGVIVGIVIIMVIVKLIEINKKNTANNYK